VEVHLQPANFLGATKKEGGGRKCACCYSSPKYRKKLKILTKFCKILTFWNNRNISKLNSG
jgi:hypothetical protein